MKNFIILFALLFTSNAFCSSSHKDLFTYDVKLVQSEFKSLNELETYVLKNEGCDIKVVKELNNTLLANANISDEPKPGENKKWQLDWPSVAIGALGCILIEAIGYFSLAIAVLSTF